MFVVMPRWGLQRISAIKIWVPAQGRDDGGEFLRRFREAVVERVAGAAHGADRILLAARIEQFAQAADMHVDRTLIDIDVAAPDTVEQLLAAEHAARMLQEELQETILGRAEIDRTARTRDAALLAIKLDVAIGQHGREP